MPIATPEVYRATIERAKDGGFDHPASNVTCSQTRGVTSMVTGAEAMAAVAAVVADADAVNIALHTDHCPESTLATHMEPLVDISIERVKAGQDPLLGLR